MTLTHCESSGLDLRHDVLGLCEQNECPNPPARVVTWKVDGKTYVAKLCSACVMEMQRALFQATRFNYIHHVPLDHPSAAGIYEQVRKTMEREAMA